MRVLLASGSPRRRELLTALGIDFEVVVPDIDESTRPDEPATDYVARLAWEKAGAVHPPAGVLAIAADTTVELDGVVLGKPVDVDEAGRMLTALSGRTHRVHTGLALRLVADGGDRVDVRVVTTEVRFAPLPPSMIDWYVSTGEPMDKAGGYAIQGAGSVLVAGMAGSVTNVIGLPLHELLEMSRSLGRALLPVTI